MSVLPRACRLRDPRFRPPPSGPMRPRALSAAAAAVLLAASLTACSDADSADQSTCAPTAVSKTDGARSIAVPAAEVTVLDPGQGPARLLEASPATGTAQEVTLETSSLETSLAPTSRTSDTNQVQKTEQQLTTPLTARVVCDDPSSLEFRIGTPTTADAELAGLLGALAGSTGGISFAPGLTPTRLRLKPTESSESPARSALEQSLIGALDYAVPVPVTPVAQGASWRAVRTVSAAATLTQTMTVVLNRLDGEVATLDVQIDQTPVDSVFAIPGSQDTLQIARYSMSGSGTVTVDLRRLLPTDGTVKLKGGRELIGDDPNRPILQQNEFTLTWRKSS